MTKKVNTVKIDTKGNVSTGAPVRAVSDQIWDEIKNVKLDMFGLPGQLVSSYYKPVIADPSKCHLMATTKATSAIQQLETALGSKYDVELADRFIIVSLKK